MPNCEKIGLQIEKWRSGAESGSNTHLFLVESAHSDAYSMHAHKNMQREMPAGTETPNFLMSYSTSFISVLQSTHFHEAQPLPHL